MCIRNVPQEATGMLVRIDALLMDERCNAKLRECKENYTI